APVLERLAQCLECRTGKFRELVEEQNSFVSEHDLSDPPPSRASDQPGRRDRVGGARNGRSERSSAPESLPVTLWMRITSIASERLSGGRIDGRRWASIVLPVPGGPLSRLLCAPAAATVSASTASPWPRTSARSSPAGRALVTCARPDFGRGSGAPPLSTRAALESRSTT